MTRAASDELWTWSLNVYAVPEVKTALLGAQNGFGAHVPLILWAAHAATKGQAVTLDDARAARAAIAALSAHTRALREARRHLARTAREGSAETREAAIAHIAEAEIALEQLELDQLAGQRTRAATAPAAEALESNVAAALSAAGLDLTKPDPKQAARSLVDAFAARFTA
jgi:uncharacterized protein (TIGR02444 family)